MNTIALSFLKTKKIDYFIDNENVVFHCLKCKYGNVKMHVTSSQWSCINCKASGNLLDLNTMWEEMTSLERLRPSKVYNPRKERRSVLSLLEQLCNKHPDDTQLKNVQCKTKKLLDFLLVE